MKKLKVTEMHRLSPEEYIERRLLPITVVLDNVRSMNNVGSVFRTADAFRLEGIVLCGITACPPHPDIHKTALGAEEAVPWSYEADTLKAVENLKARGYEVCALEQAEGSTLLSDLRLDLTKRYALILGNEVHGVQQTVIDQVDTCIEIPQYGSKHSLNVSVASGVALWHMVQPFLPQLD